MNVHVLRGCAAVPLAKYLKALGILRLVGEQVDPRARGWWDGEQFCLLTRLSKEELEKFFLERYEPTPVFNPWGARSGYYPESSEKTARAALATIEGSSLSRLKAFREAIATIRSIIAVTGGEKPGSKEAKVEMLSCIRRQLRGAGMDWLETVMAFRGDSFDGPAILGTGGNEGSGGYPAAFLGAVVECIIQQGWDQELGCCLWAVGAERDAWDGSFVPSVAGGSKKGKRESIEGPFRQFLPEGAGSPWELLLCFEGAMVVQSAVTRRSNADQHRFLASPFYFAPLGIGSGTGAPMDEVVLNKGRKSPGRGEQWFPLWATPSTFAEVRQVFREGQCTVGKRGARTPIDAVRAIAGLGVSRGITAFVRYGYLQRDNQATHFAVPLGRLQVRRISAAHLVDDGFARWLDHLHRLSRGKPAPTRLIHAEHRLGDVVFAALTHDEKWDRWQEILRAAADVESLQATGTAIEAQPIPPLHPEWVSATDDGSAEHRLALALGSAASFYTKGRPVDSIRHHWLPLERGARRFRVADKRLIDDPRTVATGRDAIRDLAATVERRLIESGMEGQRRLPLAAAPGCGARLDDLAAFLAGALDLDKLLGLARAFMALRWEQWRPEYRPRAISTGDVPDEAWLALRLANLGWPLSADRDIPAEPRIVRLLLSGDALGAIRVANARLRSAGIRSPVSTGVTDSVTARRWAAALAFPIHRDVAFRAAAILDPSLRVSANV